MGNLGKEKRRIILVPEPVPAEAPVKEDPVPEAEPVAPVAEPVPA